MVSNLFGGVEPLGCIPVARRTLVHISAQESQNILSVVAFAELLAEPLKCADGALRFQKTPVENL